MNATRSIRCVSFVGLVATLVLPGCYSTPESFARRAGKLVCVNMRECQEELYETQFHGEMDECREAAEDGLDAWITSMEDMGCEYDADAGRDCIHEAYEHRKDCNAEPNTACEGVWDCPVQLDVDSDPMSAVSAILAESSSDCAE